MDLDLRLVRYFVAVADELHFGRAAAKLYISQPALSKQIRKLEAQVGDTLLVRDSRHVSLTPRGVRFLQEARDLLALASRMQQHPSPDVLRIAHIFELTTSRVVADSFSSQRDDVRLVEMGLDSISQLDALVNNRLDVAILRVSPQMLLEHPTGWKHEPLRLEPMYLVGRPGDPPRTTVSMRERPLEVFADPQGSGLYNAYGQYLTALETSTEVALRWLGTPPAFVHCLAALKRTQDSAFLLEFKSYADLYVAAGVPVHHAEEIQPYFPWSIAWRDEPTGSHVEDFVSIGLETAAQRRWLQPDPTAPAPPWLPADEPAQTALRTSRS